MTWCRSEILTFLLPGDEQIRYVLSYNRGLTSTQQFNRENLMKFVE